MTNPDGTYTLTAGPTGFALKAAHAQLPVEPEPDPDPEEPETPETPETPKTPDQPDAPVEEVTPETPTETPVKPETPAAPAVAEITAAALPKTGVNWVAALAMALSGLTLTVAGAFTRLFANNHR